MYEALEKHEQECNYQLQQCPGCYRQILKKDVDNHTTNCSLIKLTCHECNLVFKRGDATTAHTENICLKEQLRQLRERSEKQLQQLSDQLEKKFRQLHDESKEDNRKIKELTLQLNELYLYSKWLSTYGLM